VSRVSNQSETDAVADDGGVLRTVRADGWD
jgi:hypothetical protein